MCLFILRKIHAAPVEPLIPWPRPTALNPNFWFYLIYVLLEDYTKIIWMLGEYTSNWVTFLALFLL